MTVRKTALSTLTVSILITGFIFFRLYYINLLSKLMNVFFGDNEYFSVISERLSPNMHIGAFFPSLFYFCVIVIIIACFINSILDYKIALKIFSSFKSPLILSVIITISLCIFKINILQLWAIFYGCIILCLHSTLKKLLLQSESTGSYANLKLIKGFFPAIKNTIINAFSTGIRNYNNPVDEIIVLLSVFLVLLLEVIAIISYFIYFTNHWRLIFLSHLLNSQ
jgi:hypothetical protein